MTEQKYYIKGQFTKKEIYAINKSLMNQEDLMYDTPMDEEEEKYNSMCELSGDLWRKGIKVLETTKGSKQDLLNENEKLKKKLNILQLPSVPHKEIEKLKRKNKEKKEYIKLLEEEIENYKERTKFME